jgi:hypothetical protein
MVVKFGVNLNQISLETWPKSDEKLLISDLYIPDQDIINQIIVKHHYPFMDAAPLIFFFFFCS